MFGVQAPSEPDDPTPDGLNNLNEITAPPPFDTLASIHSPTLEEATRDRRATYQDGSGGGCFQQGLVDLHSNRHISGPSLSGFLTQFYTLSYLILFSILGTLARLGIQSLTLYPQAPIVASVVWANFGGSLLMGFLSEDQQIFREGSGNSTQKEPVSQLMHPEDNPLPHDETNKTKKAHNTIKRIIPLYIGLSTGFCGSFTSFSSFIRDIFLAISNDLPPSKDPRSGAYSLLAALAVISLTLSLCLSALKLGAHIALAARPITPNVSFNLMRKFLDPLISALAWGCWLAAVLMTIWPPDASQIDEDWRGQVLLSLVFAPLGCLLRFQISIKLNNRIPSFPLGTFFVNVLGSIILALCWDLQHAHATGYGRTRCQVLQGIQDGFCGCLTTVSTWVLELTALRLKHSYFYGILSVLVALGFAVIIMGSLKWTGGFDAKFC
ncbi:MAG: hypothetical protein M1829_006072 [Trizodia sp. TS-e1964]|nr:MAG: hypothetical protein M1829_006072 [Trizodia sp. TS-e1964]